MARKRTGTLVPKPSGFFARISVDLPDGTAERRWFDLETKDRALAGRKMAKLVKLLEEGRAVAEAKREAEKPQTLEQAARAWCELRKASKVAMAGNELANFTHHVFPELGTLPVAEVRKVHIFELFDKLAKKTVGKKNDRLMSRSTIGQIQRLLGRFLENLVDREVIPSNPARGVDIPAAAKVDKRKRTPLEDSEYSALLAAPVDLTTTPERREPKTQEIEFLEMKVVVFTARTLGGARAAECLRWDWAMIDRVHFRTCKLGRAKTGDVQDLEFPDMLRPFLHAWWTAARQPSHGPVFPVSRGARKGEARGKSGLAARFRRALLRAGVTRHEVHNDTAWSRKTDFHTLRREYVSALARAGVNEQTSMALAHHASSEVHKRYNLAQIVAVPVSALPAIKPASPWILSPPVTIRFGASSETPSFFERDTGFEPATSSLGSLQSITKEGVSTDDDAVSETPDGAVSDARITVNRGDSSPGADCQTDERIAIESRRLPTLIARVAEAAADRPELVAGLLAFARARTA